MPRNKDEWEYIDRYFGSTQNYLAFLSQLPEGVQPIPIHSLNTLHLYCSNEAVLKELMACAMNLLEFIEFEQLTMGTRTGSLKPANIPQIQARRNTMKVIESL